MPLEYKFSSSLGPDSHSLKCKLNGEVYHPKGKKWEKEKERGIWKSGL